jgi:hypothetical protein
MPLITTVRKGIAEFSNTTRYNFIMKYIDMKKLFLVSGVLALFCGFPATESAAQPFNIVETIYEPATQHRYSIFNGTFETTTVLPIQKS